MKKGKAPLQRGLPFFQDVQQEWRDDETQKYFSAIPLCREGKARQKIVGSVKALFCRQSGFSDIPQDGQAIGGMRMPSKGICTDFIVLSRDAADCRRCLKAAALLQLFDALARIGTAKAEGEQADECSGNRRSVDAERV